MIIWLCLIFYGFLVDGSIRNLKYAAGDLKNGATYLKVSPLELDDLEGLSEFASLLTESSIKKLDLSGCFLGDKAISIITNALMESSIESLILPGNRIHNLSSIARLAMRSQTLVELDLSRTRINAVVLKPFWRLSQIQSCIL